MPTTPKSGPPSGWPAPPPSPPPGPPSPVPPPAREHSGWGTGQPPPPPKPPTPQELEAAADRQRQRMRLFLVTLVGMVVVWQLQLPFRLGGIVLSLIAIWTGIRLLIGLAAPARAGVRPRGRGGIITGLVLSVAVLLILAAEAVYYPVVSDLEQCRAEADTQTAQDLCDQATKDRIERLKEELDRRAANS